jgi:hypothetical protein
MGVVCSGVLAALDVFLDFRSASHRTRCDVTESLSDGVVNNRNI